LVQKPEEEAGAFAPESRRDSLERSTGSTEDIERISTRVSSG